MWLPDTARQVIEAAESGSMEEGPAFDAKAQLPGSKKNIDLAIDVAAMANDGGVLLYGVGEDENRRPTLPHPFELAGALERIASIVSTSLSDPPFIDPRPLPLEADPAQGFVLLHVPQSARAPHQATVGNDMRFYGRAGEINVRLTEGEIERLYARRARAAVDRDELLNDRIRLGPPAQDDLGFLHAFARPLALDTDFMDRAAPTTGRVIELLRELARTTDNVQPPSGYGPGLTQYLTWEPKGAKVWTLGREDDEDQSNSVRCDLNVDRRADLFCGRAAARPPRTHAEDSPLYIINPVIVGNLASFLSIVGAYYQAANYFGAVDLGVAITGILGATGYSEDNRHMFYAPTYNAPDYREHAQVTVAELQDVTAAVLMLLRRFLGTVYRPDWDPFKSPA